MKMEGGGWNSGLAAKARSRRKKEGNEGTRGMEETARDAKKADNITVKTFWGFGREAEPG
jgi:hypothetical protein